MRLARVPGGAWRHPFAWLRAAWLTLRYVDEWEDFPALWIWKGGRLRLRKAKGARLILRRHLVVESYLGGDALTTIHLRPGSSLQADCPVFLGDDVRILVNPRGSLRFGGTGQEPVGLTYRCLVLVERSVAIGSGCIAAGTTFVTDSDWHPVGGHLGQADTTLGEGCWLATGAQVLKGARIGSGSIVAGNAVVLAGDHPARSLLAGVPAKVVRTDLPAWSRT